MGGAVSGVAPAVANSAPSSAPSNTPSAGKSTPVAQNTYSDPYQAGGGGAANYNPSAAPQGMLGSKSAPIAQNTYSQSFDGGLPMSGGKSSGLGQGGYQAAPAFAASQQMNQQSALAAQRQAQGGFGPQAPDTSENAYNQQMATQSFSGTPPSYDQWKQQQSQQKPFDPYGRMNMRGGYGRINQQQTQQASPYGGGYNPQALSGLQSLFNQMMGQYGGAQQPQMQQPMPQYQSPALNYKPDYIRAQENLNRVQPSVQKQEQDAQAARIKELEDQLARYNTPSGE